MVAVFDKLPDVPVMMTVAGPVAAVPLAVNVNVLVTVVGFGLKEAVTPFGRTEVDKVTLPLNPFCGVTLIVLVPPAPWVIVRLVGEVERVKFGVGGAGVVKETLSKVAVAEDVVARIEAEAREKDDALLVQENRSHGHGPR